MEVTQAITLAIVEGLTEFLPVSSTGHMIIAANVMRLPQSEFLKTFEIAIQLGAIGAVFSLYWRTFLLDWEVGLKVLAAFVPTAVIGFILYRFIKQYLMGNVFVVAVALIVGGVFLIVFEALYKRRNPLKGQVEKIEDISCLQAVFIGLCQGMAVIPGVSRSAATILGGLGLGISRSTIVEFSFLLAVPTMAAATGLDILRNGGKMSFVEFGLLGIGFVGAFAVALATVKFLLHYVKRHDFIFFGFYRIAVGLLVLLLFSKA